VIIKTQKQKAKQLTENLSVKLENSNKNSTFYWVIWLEQPGPGATLLGWRKSTYYIDVK